MTERFYTNFELDWDNILLSYYEDGKKYNTKVKLKPYLFVPSALDKAEYKTYDGKNVMRVDFDSVKEARDFVESYEDAANFKIYGSPLYHYVYIYENFKDQKVDTKKIRILNYDIEYDTTYGFHTHGRADREINAITAKIFGSKDVYVLSLFEYDLADQCKKEPEMQKLIDAGYKIHHRKCSDEAELLRLFVDLWCRLAPDVITGWNVKLFDNTYIINRIKEVIGESYAKSLSPFGKLTSNTINLFNKEYEIYNIVGIPTLDYMDIYKKFSMGVEESYSLNYLSGKILNATKLDYSEYGSLAKLQKLNPMKYVSYNIIDVIRVEQIDEKVKYMDIAFEIAYETLTNYADSMTTIRVWDAMIHNYLMDRNIVVPHRSENRKDRSIAGGFVKDPIIGKHEWVMSFDFKSLYPHLCMTFNISPDTYLGTFKPIVGADSVDKIIRGDLQQYADVIQKQDVTVTGAGTVFSRKKKGFIPAIMEHLFDMRAHYSKLEDMYTKKAAEEGDAEAGILSQIYGNKSYAIKILLNSGYGALSNEYYRFFHNLIAESFTLSGQLAIRTVAEYVNNKVNNLLNTENVDYIIAIDTDSFYLNMSDIVRRASPDDPVQFMEDYSDTVQEWIQEGLAGLYKSTNAFQKKLFMSLESIGPAIWVAKKRYVMSLPSYKKVRYNPPKIKIMGIEAVRSTTPQIVRKWITDAIPIALQGDAAAIKKYIDDRWNEFLTLDLATLAMPKGTNDLEKYSSSTTIYTQRTPLHVRGALLFNNHCIKNKWDNDISLIKSGDKVRVVYLKLPNPLMENVISVPEDVPPQFKEFEDYIDYEKQFDKVFLDPLRRITDAANINLSSNISMDEFYG